MPRRRSSCRRQNKASNSARRAADKNDDEEQVDGPANDEEEQQEAQQRAPPPPPRRSVAAHVRNRQRAVAEREAARLARPEARVLSTLAHADRKKSAVTSTPFGVLRGTSRNNASAMQQQQQRASLDDEEEWCGPFAVARQLIAERDRANKAAAAAAAAEADHPLDNVMLQLEHERKRKQHPSIQWKSGGGSGHLNTSTTTSGGRPESAYAKRQRRANVQSQQHKIPSLFTTCIQFLVHNIDAVESLGQGVDSSIRTKIAHALVARQKLDATTLPAIIEPGMDALQLVDCCQIPQMTLSTCLQMLLPTGLKLLSLDQAGRCFGPQVVHDMIRSCSTSSSSLSSSRCQLAGLAIGGAYLLKDEDAAALITALQATLVSLEFKACPLLGVHLCRSLATTPANTIASTPLLELSLQDLSFSPEAWAALLSESESSSTTTTTTTTTSTATSSSSKALSRLENLRLQQMTGLTDAMVAQLLQRCGKSLQRLDLSHNHDLTDSTLAAIRQYCCYKNNKNTTKHGNSSHSNGNGSNSNNSSGLRHLSLANLKLLTNAGLQALFTNVVVLPQHDDTTTVGDDDANDAASGVPEDDVVVVAVSDTPPPRLESLDLGRCDYQAVTDEVIDLVTQAAIASTNITSTSATNKDDNDDDDNKGGQQKHSNTVGGLVRLNIQGASLVTDTSMEYLVATCADTLQDLNVSFCGRISNQGLGYLVDSSSLSSHGPALRKLHVWGCAQLSDEFFEGHARVDDANLEILGAWIKSKQPEVSTSNTASSPSLLASPL
jgi:hypothetical protein